MRSKGPVRTCLICGKEFQREERSKLCSLQCNGIHLQRLSMDPKRTAKRFWSRVNKNGPVPEHRPELGPCWVWTGRLSWKGYGYFVVSGKTHNASRVAWLVAHGSWPNSCALHRCDRASCVRPDHLFEGTVADNNHDMVTKGRSRKARGSAAGRAKLTEEQVRSIRLRFDDGECRRALAREFGIGDTTVRAILDGRTWRHVA